MRRYGTRESLSWYENQPISDKWTLLRKLGKEKLTPVAQLKLEWIIFYHTVSHENARKTAQHFSINPKTFHKWKKRFSDKNLFTLEENSRAPIKTRQRDISLLQRERVRKLRKKHIRWGKMKLQTRYHSLYQESISSWKIQKIIEQEHLYYDKMRAHKQRIKRRRAQKQPKNRINVLQKQNTINHLWHVDTVLLTRIGGGYHYLITGIDDVSKLAYARLYRTHSSKYAADFLQRLHYLTEGAIINLHHDNGSEFQKDFECQV